jgi:D-alanine-D-alanine ligase
MVIKREWDFIDIFPDIGELVLAKKNERLKIGLTYDLRDEYLAEGYSEEETAEFDRKDTIDVLEQSIHKLGYQTDRIGHIKNLINRLATGQRWDMVFNIAEGLRGFGREAQVPAVLDAYDIPYTFSDPLILALTLHKGMTKHVVRNFGIPTPDFAVIEKINDLKMINLPFPLFVKPVAEGTGKGVHTLSKVASHNELFEECERLLEVFKQPVIVETFLPGREFTVGIIGTGEDAYAIGVLEVCLRAHAERDAYSYVNKEKCEDLVEYHLVNDDEAQAAKGIALKAWEKLGCRDAGRVDLRVDAKGIPNFMEVNPLPGLHPEHSDLPILCALADISYSELIAAIVNSAFRRTHNT